MNLFGEFSPLCDATVVEYYRVLLEYDIFKHLKVIFPALSCETTTIKLDFEFHILLRGNFCILVRGGNSHLLDSKSYNRCFDMTQHD